jgi:putative NADPH-quinone reductase/catechol 2,3-dioxygenase-like lactoylglutathione lyase family enzyme
MKLSLILAHPGPGSFNHAIAETARQTLLRRGHTVFFHDLCAEGFDPILPAHEIPKCAALPPEIARHCAEIAAADGIIVVHPNWWGQPPAILKGWIDRVIRPGVAYEFLESDSGEGVPLGLLRARTALVFNTTNTPLERERQVFGDPLETLWKNCVFGLCGVNDFHRRVFGVIVTSTAEQRAAWLAEVNETLDRCFPAAGSANRQAPRMRVYAIDHIQLTMPAGEEARARAFYAELLGLEEIAKPPELAGRGGAWFSNGAVTLHIGVEQDFRPARKAHPALLVEGLTAFVARLEAAGYPIQRDVQFVGYDRVHVNDPFGNRIELMERAE